jgi:TPR repeat protein
MRHYFHLLLLATALISISLAAQETVSVAKLPIAQLQKLAESGDPAAQNELGVRYRMGTDVEKDPAKAVPWFFKAARQGYAKAYFNLGAAYYNGDGVAVNDDDSCVWFMLSADAGDQSGVNAIARNRQQLSRQQMNRCEVMTATAYLMGERNKQDYGKAMQWYVAAANTGDAVACEKIAYMYDRGLGVPADKQESVRWLKRAADLNYPPAIYELGMTYESGGVVAPDLGKAKKLYEQASLLGFPQAFKALGNVYNDGRGVKIDREKALAYYIVAANNGDVEAKVKEAELSAQLSAKEVSAAKKDALNLVMMTKSPVILVRK